MSKVSNVRRGPASTEGNTVEAKAPVVDLNSIQYVEDELGRKVGFRRLKRSERYLLNEATNASNMSNGIESLVAASVVSVDQEGFPAIKSKEALLARLDELGDEVIGAVTQPIMKLYGLLDDAEQDAKDRAKIKN